MTAYKQIYVIAFNKCLACCQKSVSRFYINTADTGSYNLYQLLSAYFDLWLNRKVFKVPSIHFVYELRTSNTSATGMFCS